MDLSRPEVVDALKQWRAQPVTNDMVNDLYRLGSKLIPASTRSEECMAGMFIGYFMLLDFIDSAMGAMTTTPVPKELLESFTEAALNENDLPDTN